MPIIDLQRRIRETGRIRIGVTAITRTGKKAPRKLDRFRFTSPDTDVIDAIAARYGGQPAPWDNAGRPEAEVITDARSIPILIPPDDMSFSQWYERWAKGFCTSRCDGAVDVVRDCPCDCDPSNRACKPTTRLSVLLAELATIGTWRLETHGWYAAVELAAALELIGNETARRRRLLPARLLLAEREVRRLDAGKPTVHQFVVPAIDLDLAALAALDQPAGGGGLPAAGQPELAAPAAIGPGTTPGGWSPVPPDTTPVPSLAEQLAAVDNPPPKPRRRNAAQALPATGLPHRTHTGTGTPAPAGALTCATCDQPIAAGEQVIRRAGRNHHAACTKGRRGGTPSGPSTPATEPAPPPTSQDRPAGHSPAGGAPPNHDHDHDEDQGDDGQGQGGDGQHDESDGPVSGTPLLTSGQNRKIHALATSVFPDHTDSDRRTEILAIAAVCGQHAESRKDLTATVAAKVIDALGRIEAGEADWIDGRIVDRGYEPFPDEPFPTTATDGLPTEPEFDVDGGGAN